MQEYAQKLKCYLNHVFSFLPVTLLLHCSYQNLEKCKSLKYFNIYFPHKHVRIQGKISKTIVLLKMGKQSNQYIYSYYYTDPLLSLRRITPFWKCNKGKYFRFCSIIVLCDKRKRILNYSGKHRKKIRITLKTYFCKNCIFITLFKHHGDKPYKKNRYEFRLKEELSSVILPLLILPPRYTN